MKTRLIEGVGTSEESWVADGTVARLRATTPDAMVPIGRRCVVVAPHPDDEVLPCGGLLAELAKRNRDILIVAVTDGEKSHRPGSLWSAERLRETRPKETHRALRHLGLETPRTLRLGMTDGAVTCAEVEDRLRAMILPEDIILTPWALDGHPDHEATCTGVRNAARAVRAMIIEMPIWGWHWADPQDPRLPWDGAVRLPLDAKVLEQKRRAIAEFHSQLEPDLQTSQPAILPPTALRRFTRSWETYFFSQ